MAAARVGRLPPGVSFILRGLLHLSIPPSVSFLASVLVARYLKIVVPTSLVVLAPIAGVQLWNILKNVRRKWWIEREAARLGAILPPRWDGKLPMSLDIITGAMQEFEHGYPGDWVDIGLAAREWTAQFNIIGDQQYITADANIIKTVLSTEFNNYVKGEEFQAASQSVLGSGVFNSDGDMWKFHRSMARPFFSKDRISHFDLFDQQAAEAISKMTVRLRAGHAVNFQDLVFRFTLDNATSFMFGKCVNSLHSPLPYAHSAVPPASEAHKTAAAILADRFSEAFAIAQRVTSRRIRVGTVWPLYEMFADETDAQMRTVDTFLNPIIQDALTRQQERARQGQQKGLEDEDGATLLDHLADYTADRTVLHDQVLNILIAGRDTTSAAMTFMGYFLCAYPEVFRKLRAEVLAIVGPHRRPTYDDIKAMKYLRAVINETLRLYPSVPFDIRCSEEAGLLPNPDPNGRPYYIPPRTPISYSIMSLHRRKDYWGPDADEFDPDRFLDERVGKYLSPNPSIFIPFNSGPRICLGQQFAYNVMSFFFIRLAQRFSAMELVPSAQPPGTLPPKEWAGEPGRKGVERIFPSMHLTLYVKGGLWLKMTEAEN